MTALASTNSALKAQMTNIGFVGSDLTVNRSGSTLSLTSSVVPSTGETLKTLADTSQTVSRVGHKVSITSTVDGAPIPEDLLVAVQGHDATGVRKMAARFDPDTVRQNPTMPDIEVEVTDTNEISIYAIKLDSNGQAQLDASGAPMRGDLLAKRTYQPGVPISYLDSSFVIDGNAATGDLFRVTTDPTRTGDNRNALAMIDIGSSDLLGKGSGAFRDIYAAAVSKIGSSSQAAKTAASSAKTVADNVAAAYDSATGVNLDTEAAELIKLQQAYTACAQIVSTARDMFEMILKAF
jgi:flagellar hook-associated protein FlgK